MCVCHVSVKTHHTGTTELFITALTDVSLSLSLCVCVCRLEAAKDDYRIHCEELEKQLIEVQHRNDELTSLAEESRALKDELDILRCVCLVAFQVVFIAVVLHGCVKTTWNDSTISLLILSVVCAVCIGYKLIRRPSEQLS